MLNRGDGYSSLVGGDTSPLHAPELGGGGGGGGDDRFYSIDNSQLDSSVPVRPGPIKRNKSAFDVIVSNPLVKKVMTEVEQAVEGVIVEVDNVVGMGVGTVGNMVGVDMNMGPQRFKEVAYLVYMYVFSVCVFIASSSSTSE
jgi:hypothetical protein